LQGRAKCTRPSLTILPYSGQITPDHVQSAAVQTAFLEEIQLANTASAIKRVRSNARKAARNKIVRTRARSMIRKARADLEENPAAAKESIMAAAGALDRAAAKGVIHKNNAARRKGRLMKKLAALPKSS